MKNDVFKEDEDFLFGTESEIKILRDGKRCVPIIGNRNLLGVTYINIIIEAGKPLRYEVRGEVVNEKKRG